MDDTYICPRCNGELEVIFEDRRGKAVPGLSAYSQPDCVCAVTCHHCDWTFSGYFKESDFDAIFFPDVVKRYAYQRFCERVMKRPMRRYRPINDTVTAVQWTGQNYKEMQMLIGHNVNWTDMREVMNITDYIVRQTDGEFSILPEKDFKERYEEVLK